MRKILMTTLILFLFSLGQAQAHGDSQVSIDKSLDNVFKSQGVNEIKQINCKEVTDEQLEQLGESFMDVMHPDSREHELMDQMMGGEGSSSLKAAHIIMGQRYLGCGGRETSMMSGMMGTMGTGMMGWSNWGGYSMMGGYNSMIGWFGWVVMILFLILVVAAIMALIKWLTNQGGKK